jgi:hypothetical protein
MSDKTKFVQDLQLAFPSNIYEHDHENRFRVTLEAGESTAQSYLADASIVSFAENVSPAFRQDVLNSVLIAQMAANAAHPDKKDLMKWFDEYLRV